MLTVTADQAERLMVTVAEAAQAATLMEDQQVDSAQLVGQAA